ncbi:MAG TPA: DUF2780 domain-containing protein [Steroidobacter sp.]|uniref:DUF2780 domain-containing protein n=1 Tax=Steroidobacter sp. TaxID=1978227 RepID=UPI002ED8F8CE
MYTTLQLRWRRACTALVSCAFVVCASNDYTFAQQARQGMIEELQQRFGLQEPQVRGALGALLLYARERLPKPEFDEFAQAIPDAYHIIDQVKARGVVTRPLDDIGDYEASLASLGIAHPIAEQFAPAVIELLGAAGHDNERDILTRLLR